MSVPIEVTEKKKRVRSFRSCVVCRQRKIKCDRQRPYCGECTKKNKTHLCRYQDTKWSTIEGGEGIERRTLAIGLDGETEVHNTTRGPDWVAPEYQNCSTGHDHDNTFNFYKNYFPSPSILSQAPLSWFALFRKDLFLHAVVVSEKPKSPTMKLSAMHLTSKDSEFLQKWNDEHLEHFHEPMIGDLKKKLFKKLYSEFTMEEDYFFEKVKDFIKDESLVHYLINRFFSTEFYILLGFYDEAEFRERIIIILSYINDQPVLRIDKLADLAIFGSLLLIMRIASVSLYNFSKPSDDISQGMPNNINELQYLHEHPVSKDIVPFIEKLKFEFITHSANAPPSLEVFQFLLSISYYDQFAPESADCVKSASSLKFSDLITYALQCGLDRDPSNNVTALNVNQDKNLLRRLWYGLVELDCLHYIMLGPSLIIDHDSYNTQLPKIDESRNEIEKLCNQWTIDQYGTHCKYVKILKLILNLRNPPEIDRVLNELKNFNSFVSSLKKFEDIVSSPADTLQQRVENIKDFIALHDSYSLLFMIDFHLFIHFSHNRDDSTGLFYLNELLEIFNILYKSILFLDPKNTKYNFQRVFGSGVIVFPKMEASFHRVHQVLFAIVGRIKAYTIINTHLTNNDASEEIFNSVKSIMFSITKLVKHNLSNYVRVSYTYYHTWIICKVQALILNKALALPLENTAFMGIANGNIIRFVTIINKYKSHDLGFNNYSSKDFKQIADKLTEITKICDYNETTIPKNDDNKEKNNSKIQPETWNLNTVLENDNIWFDRMMRDYNNVNKRPSPVPSQPYNKLKITRAIPGVTTTTTTTNTNNNATSEFPIPPPPVTATTNSASPSMTETSTNSGIDFSLPPGDLVDMVYSNFDFFDIEGLIFEDPLDPTNNNGFM